MSDYELLDSEGVYFSHSAILAYLGVWNTALQLPIEQEKDNGNRCDSHDKLQNMDKKVELRLGALPTLLTLQGDSLDSIQRGEVLALQIWNGSDSCLYLGFSDVIPGDFEAMDTTGEWSPLNTYCTGCAISSPTDNYLPPGQLAVMVFDFHKGGKSFQIRYRMGKTVSNELTLMLDPKWMRPVISSSNCWC